MRTTCLSILGAFGLLISPLAQADVVNATPDGFELKLTRSSNIEALDQYERIFDIADWWSSAHTWSGDAASLSLTSRDVGGQWRESWANGDVEHGRIIASGFLGGKFMVRFDAPLGPLQGMGVQSVLTMEVQEVSEIEGTSEVTFTYFVTGADFQALNQIAPVVDGVLSEQIDRLVSVRE
ncbi:MAG: ATPase [Ponticaulis sp.]|nr:ATPase [Ponticaulis sp.]